MDSLGKYLREENTVINNKDVDGYDPYQQIDINKLAYIRIYLNNENTIQLASYKFDPTVQRWYSMDWDRIKGQFSIEDNIVYEKVDDKQSRRDLLLNKEPVQRQQYFKDFVSKSIENYELNDEIVAKQHIRNGKSGNFVIEANINNMIATSPKTFNRVSLSYRDLDDKILIDAGTYNKNIQYIAGKFVGIQKTKIFKDLFEEVRGEYGISEKEMNEDIKQCNLEMVQLINGNNKRLLSLNSNLSSGFVLGVGLLIIYFGI